MNNAQYKQRCHPRIQRYHHTLPAPRQPSYGYEISKQIKLISEEKYVIKETTLYSAFTRLEKNGYITSFSSSDNASGKRRTYYQITDAGREYYRMKCEEWKLTLDVVSKFIRF